MNMIVETMIKLTQLIVLNRRSSKNIRTVTKDEREKELNLTIYPLHGMEEKNIRHINLIYNASETNSNNRFEINK